MNLPPPLRLLPPMPDPPDHRFELVSTVRLRRVVDEPDLGIAFITTSVHHPGSNLVELAWTTTQIPTHPEA